MARYCDLISGLPSAPLAPTGTESCAILIRRLFLLLLLGAADSQHFRERHHRPLGGGGPRRTIRTQSDAAFQQNVHCAVHSSGRIGCVGQRHTSGRPRSIDGQSRADTSSSVHQTVNPAATQLMLQE